jgi:hypothetical protein
MSWGGSAPHQHQQPVTRLPSLNSECSTWADVRRMASVSSGAVQTKTGPMRALFVGINRYRSAARLLACVNDMTATSEEFAAR